MEQLEKDVLKWYNKSKYNRLGNDVSVTELLRPPRINHLMNRHGRAVKTDGNKIIAALIGNGVHDQLQRYLRDEARVNGNWQIERRLCSVIEGKRVSGRFDALYNNEILYDIKVTKAYKAIKGDTTEWEQQLNCYDWMLWKDGIDIKSIKIFMVVLDFNKGDSWKQGYPAGILHTIPIPRWTRQVQENWLKTKVKLWKSTVGLEDDKLPLCTPQERWSSGTIYKLYRTPTLQRANKTFPVKQRAINYMKACQTKEPKKWAQAIIRENTGESWRRCGYCDAAPHCNQFINKIEI